MTWFWREDRLKLIKIQYERCPLSIACHVTPQQLVESTKNKIVSIKSLWLTFSTCRFLPLFSLPLKYIHHESKIIGWFKETSIWVDGWKMANNLYVIVLITFIHHKGIQAGNFLMFFTANNHFPCSRHVPFHFRFLRQMDGPYGSFIELLLFLPLDHYCRSCLTQFRICSKKSNVAPFNKKRQYY